MNSTNSSQPWSELLCCTKCKEVFSRTKLPINLICGHLMCKECTQLDGVTCSLDKTGIDIKSKLHYINGPVLSILDGKQDLNSITSSFKFEKEDSKNLEEIEQHCYSLAKYLYKVESDRGVTISSSKISRTIQRKLLAILCTNILSKDGRKQFIRILRSLLERIVSELILHLSSGSNLSSSLWNAVRARGCQFLGPGMQEDVLKIIHCAMLKGDSIARKTLVLLIVQKLSPDYSHISKTCAGHVVQLLYRASCFNVIKREGQSSLMQMKEQFRNYDSLRFEHDTQIVQIAMEAGLRISPDQWSSLLYGDSKHRAHMQSICDHLSDNSFKKAVEELQKLVEKQPPERNLFGISAMFQPLEDLIADGIESANAEFDWAKIKHILDSVKPVLSVYSNYIQSRNAEREQQLQPYSSGITNFENPSGNNSKAYFGREQPPKPLRERNNARITNIPSNMGFESRPMPLLPYHAQQNHQHSNSTMANYIYETTMPMPINTSPPPAFFAQPLNFSPSNPIQMAGMKGVAVGPSHSDPFVPTTLMTVLPLSPQRSATPLMPNPSTTPTLYSTRPSIIFIGNSASPTECTTLTNSIIAPSQQINGNPILSSSPPTYQFSPGGLIPTTPATAYSIPVQPSQSLIVYGSSPPGGFTFGSPPLLFPQWVTPMENTALHAGYGLNFYNNAAAPEGMSYYGGHGETSSYSYDDSEDSNDKNEKRHNSSGDSHTEGHDNHECHVSFMVATSVLNDDKFGTSVGSWTLELPPNQNNAILLSPSHPRNHSSTTQWPFQVITPIHSSSYAQMSSVSALFGGTTPSLTTGHSTIHEMGKNLSVSS